MTMRKTSEFIDTKRMPSGLTLTRVHAEGPRGRLGSLHSGKILDVPNSIESPS